MNIHKSFLYINTFLKINKTFVFCQKQDELTKNKLSALETFFLEQRELRKQNLTHFSKVNHNMLHNIYVYILFIFIFYSCQGDIITINGLVCSNFSSVGSQFAEKYTFMMQLQLFILQLYWKRHHETRQLSLFAD